MKKNDKRRRVLAGLEIVGVALTIAAGTVNFAGTRDWKWICWIVIVLCLELRIWLAQDALRRKEDEAETWRVLYNKANTQMLDLAWENENLRKREDGE